MTSAGGSPQVDIPIDPPAEPTDLLPLPAEGLVGPDSWGTSLRPVPTTRAVP